MSKPHVHVLRCFKNTSSIQTFSLMSMTLSICGNVEAAKISLPYFNFIWVITKQALNNLLDIRKYMVVSNLVILEINLIEKLATKHPRGNALAK